MFQNPYADITFEEGKWPFMRKIRRVTYAENGWILCRIFLNVGGGTLILMSIMKNQIWVLCRFKVGFCPFPARFFSVKTQSANVISKHSKTKFTNSIWKANINFSWRWAYRNGILLSKLFWPTVRICKIFETTK